MNEHFEPEGVFGLGLGKWTADMHEVGFVHRQSFKGAGVEHLGMGKEEHFVRSI
jgi:hypothetical protein